MRENRINSECPNRRQVLKSVGATAATGIAFGSVGTGAAKSAADRVKRLKGAERDKYIRRAYSEVTSAAEYNEFISRLSRRGYSLEVEDALVTRHVDNKTTNVFFPLNDERNRISIDPISEYGENANLGHVLWTTGSSSATALITGDADTLTDGLTFVSDASLPTDGSGVEVIGPESHEIEISTDFNGSTIKRHDGSPSGDVDAAVTFAHIDVSAERVRTPQPDFSQSAVRAARTSCPDSIPVILAAIGGCGGSCATCPSAGLGNLPALFACIACAGCGCGLGCCIGERSSSACAFASTVLAAPWLFNGGVVGGATCINEGCNDNSCF